MVVVSHLFLFLWKSFRGRFDSCKSNLPLFGTIISRQSLLNEKYNCRLIEKLYRIMDEVNQDRKDCD